MLLVLIKKSIFLYFYESTYVNKKIFNAGNPLSLLGSGCSERSQSESIILKQQEVVKIGVIAPLSGPNAGYGLDAVNVYQDRVNQFNKNHSDVQVELIIEDGKAEGPAAASAAQKLIMVDKIDVLLGGWSNIETMTAAPIGQANKITTLSVGATASSISNIGDYVYRFWNDALAVKKLAKYINQKYKKIAIFYEKTSAAKQEFHDEFLKRFNGDNVVSLPIDATEKDYSLLVKKLEKEQENVE